MRLWSMHPRYLDQKGLGGLWREGLLALNVLQGNTKGYKNHSQLIRFKELDNPAQAVSDYLHVVCDEADARGYNYNRSKLLPKRGGFTKIPLSEGQFNYESKWLQHKLESRDPNMYIANEREGILTPHPMFRITAGDIATWEIVKDIDNV